MRRFYINIVIRVIGLCGILVTNLACQTTLETLTISGLQTTDERQLEWRINDYAETSGVTQADIFHLTEEQQQHFLSYYHGEQNQSVPGHRRLYDYLEGMLDGFSYKGDTNNASTALSTQSGNCLSLAIVTTALAELVQLDIKYQRVNTAPIYQRFHNVMTLSSHVRTHVYAPKQPLDKGQILLIRAKLVIDYFPESTHVSGDFVTRSNFIAMFYQNLAGDALIGKDFQKAYGFLADAMKVDAKNPETLNTLAVLHKALGNTQNAEDIYVHALDNTTGSLNVLSNYAELLTSQGRTNEAQALQNKLVKINDDNPYRWYDVAQRQFSKQKYAIALKYYKRAIEVAPYLHEGYFGLAKTYHQIGLKAQAKVAMEKASELAFTPADTFLYEAKLRVLKASEQ